jgi:hypothetical protein
MSDGELTPSWRARLRYAVLGVPLFAIGILALSHWLIYGGGGATFAGAVLISCALRGKKL